MGIGRKYNVLSRQSRIKCARKYYFFIGMGFLANFAVFYHIMKCDSVADMSFLRRSILRIKLESLKNRSIQISEMSNNVQSSNSAEYMPPTNTPEHESRLPQENQNKYSDACSIKRKELLGIPDILRTGCNNCDLLTCDRLLSRDPNDVIDNSTRTFLTNSQQVERNASDLDTNHHKMSMNCEEYIQNKGFLLNQVTKEEIKFPIAFNILMHRDIQHFELLLSTIYRPQNTYCIHIDAKSPLYLHKSVQSMVRCFSNVFIASRLVNVTYAGFSRLQADINCMSDHVTGSVPWKYLINLATQAFPLKTNAEIVKILKIYNGANDIEGGYFPKLIKKLRVEKYWMEGNGAVYYKLNETYPPPPHGLRLAKGSAYGVFSRRFVEYLLGDPVARDFLEWSRHTYSPDEHFWNTLHHTERNPNITSPGSYNGPPQGKPFLASYSVWEGNKGTCRGKFVHGVCIFGIDDLPSIIRQPHLFANKLYIEYQPATLQCLVKWLQYKGLCPTASTLDTGFYKDLPFVIPRNQDSVK